MTELLTHPYVFVPVAVVTGVCLLAGLLSAVVLVIAAFDDGRQR